MIDAAVNVAGGPAWYVADLFAGAGGFTEGFRLAGFTPAMAVEWDTWAAKSYAANFGNHVLACAIEHVEVQRFSRFVLWEGYNVEGAPVAFETPHIDVLIGGPPCQGFSPLGRMADWDKEDPRNKLWRHYARILKTLSPKVFVIENVPELLASQEFATLKKTVEDLGYEVDHGVLNAAKFGVPQTRKRAIVIGSRLGTPSLPKEGHERMTVRQAIGDLPSRPDGKNGHVPRNPSPISIERYKCIPAGGNRFDLLRERPDITPDCWKRKKTGSVDVFGRMEWDKPSPTIRTEFFKPEKGRYLHPKAHRPITIREAARLQTFPDSFKFEGSNVQVAKQIGNAVPVKLAEVIANHIKDEVLKRRRERTAAKVNPRPSMQPTA